MFINGVHVDLMKGYTLDSEKLKQVKELMMNHRYNLRINWENVRYQRKRKRNEKTSI